MEKKGNEKIFLNSKYQRAQREREHYNKGLRRGLYNKIFSHCDYYYKKMQNEKISKALLCSEGKIILEFGTIVAAKWIETAKAKPRCLHCINISEKELIKGKNRKKNLNIKFYLMDANFLGFKEDTFDFVIGDAILHHIDFVTSIGEIKRVLKLGG